jgi:hypothetical protein
MQTVTTIGLDIAKSVFQVHGVDAAGQVVIRRSGGSASYCSSQKAAADPENRSSMHPPLFPLSYLSRGRTRAGQFSHIREHAVSAPPHLKGGSDFRSKIEPIR